VSVEGAYLDLASAVGKPADILGHRAGSDLIVVCKLEVAVLPHPPRYRLGCGLGAAERGENAVGMFTEVDAAGERPVIVDMHVRAHVGEHIQ
jgi:hypothetical protein